MDNKGNQNKNGKNPRGQNYAVLIMTMLFTLLCVAMMHNLWQGSRTHKMPYSEFNQMLKDHEVESVVIGNGKIQITPKEDSKKYGGSQGKYGNLVGMEYYTIPINDPDLEKKLDEAGVTTYEQAEVDATGSIIMLLLEWVLPIAAMFVIFNMMMKRMGGGGGIMGVGKSNAKVYVQKETGVTFKDVAGEDEAKESLTEIVDFLHNPGKYTKIGAKLPKGALLVGPPGTGKTLLAKAVAGEAKVPFFSLSGSDFVEMFVGVGASRVRDLFKQAQQSAPCIIFIDEVDAIGKSRDSRLGGNDEREQTLNQLLSEMDGFDSSKGLLVMAATNRPEILDPALLRPGRFDRRIIVDKPDLKGRVQILKVHSKDVLLDETVDFKEIALATSGAVGADLANMMNEAAINAVKNGRNAVSQKDLFEAVEVVLVGKEKKDRIMSKEERRIVMRPLRQVSKREKIIFPIMITVFVALLVPSAAPLIACLMLGNLFKESGVVERLQKTAGNELMNIVTIFLGFTVGATATATTFLSVQTLEIMAMGIVAFGFGTAGGVLLAKLMNLFLKEKINPLIGSAGVSAVPMAARVSQVVGQKENPSNFLLMHAMGPNVAGVIGSAIAAGVLMSLFG